MLYAGLLEAKPNSVTDKQYTSSLRKDWMILASNIVAASASYDQCAYLLEASRVHGSWNQSSNLCKARWTMKNKTQDFRDFSAFDLTLSPNKLGKTALDFVPILKQETRQR